MLVMQSSQLPTQRLLHSMLIKIVLSSCDLILVSKIDDDWYDKCEDDEYMAYLNAPLMKDMDSFTEGTGHGSFDCLPSAYNDEHEQLFPPIDSLSLSLLPPVEALSTSIVTWRDNIMDTQTSSDPVDIPRPKRQRSASPVYVRNTRARAQSLSSVINWPPSIECPFSRADVERRSRSEAPD